MADHRADAEAARQAEARAQAIGLLDAQLKVLSDRLIEAGKNADHYLTQWATLTGLVALLVLGVGGDLTISGLKLNALVAAAVCFVGTCAFYYRVCLSFAAITKWRGALRERRFQRFSPILVFDVPNRGSDQLSEEQSSMRAEMNAFVPEYPGFVAASVLLKDEARQARGTGARIVVATHYLAQAVFLGAHWLLAIGLVIRACFSAWYVVIVVAVALVVGLSFAVAGTQLIRVSLVGGLPKPIEDVARRS